MNVSNERFKLLFQAQSRSKVNYGEADMVIALALFLLGQGCRESDITILAAYLGQTKILRQKLKEAKDKYPQLFDETDETISVQTIDLFQVLYYYYFLNNLFKIKPKKDKCFIMEKISSFNILEGLKICERFPSFILHNTISLVKVKINFIDNVIKFRVTRTSTSSFQWSGPELTRSDSSTT